MDLDSFEKVMQAMDQELAKAKSAKSPPSSSASKPVPTISSKPTSTAKNGATLKAATLVKSLAALPTEQDLDAMSDDELAAMDRELRVALKGAGIEDSDEEMEGEDDPLEARELYGDDRREYKMMKDFLESYKSQGGGAGAVGNLFGRLGEQK